MKVLRDGVVAGKNQAAIEIFHSASYSDFSS
jgi:hypothetical protein